MLAVHGFWSTEQGLCLWAEDATRPVKSRSQARRSARPHPFAASADVLSDIYPGRADRTCVNAATVLLPSLLSAPLDSPEVVRANPRTAPTRAPMLSPWSVPVITFGPREALAVLEQPAPDDVRCGDSVRYLAELAAFAGGLARAGRVLPTLDSQADDYVARWRPVLMGPDIVTMQTLVNAIPPICRAETDAPSTGRGRDPVELITRALYALTDAAVRDRLTATRTSPMDAARPRRGRRPKRRPAAEAWLAALATPDGQFEAEPDAADELQRHLAPWSDFGLGQTGPARATFSLVEAHPQPVLPYDPDVEGDGQEPVEPVARPPSAWRLEFWLQSIQDPSLLVPANQVWAAGDGLRRWLSRPDELMLAELGRASTIYPELSGALREARPSGLELDADGAYHFLAAKAVVLEQAGFGVLLPAWWNRRRRLGLTGKASTPTDARATGPRFGRDQLMAFEWQLAIGDTALTAEELAALAATKAPLVQLRGEWVAVDPEQLKLGLEFLARQPVEPQHWSAADLIALAASHPDDGETPLPVNAVQADGWLGDLLTGAAERHLQPVTPPEGVLANLRPYQLRGLSWLAFMAELGLGACLADDMGLGKTLQLLSLEVLHRRQRTDPGPTLLLCPMSLVGNWQREAARFTPGLRVYAHHGRERLTGTDLDQQVASTDLVVTTYATAVRDLAQLSGYAWQRIVLDEAQAVKNSRSQAAQAIRSIDTEHRVALTGTPMENRLSELWSIMDFLNPGILGSAQAFRARYAVPIERYAEPEPADRLRRVTRPYLLRRLKTDTDIITDLPDKIEVKQYCHLTPEQASLYRTVVDEMMTKIETSDGIQRRGNVLAAMLKLKQVCNHPAQLLRDRSALGRRSGKVTRLEEILDEILAEGDKVLCFTQFTGFAELLVPHLAARFDTEVLYLHGGTPKKRRDEMVERFQSGDSGPSVFLLSLKAGGTGLNLTAANQVIHLDRWWNPAVENQATDRAFRIGQHRNVQVRKFICVGTLEEKIDDMIEDKKALADLVISDGEQWLTELSTGALRDMFTLAEGAVGE